jgi:hypothetical protein
LCKKQPVLAFACPIVVSMLSNGGTASYVNSATDGTWTATGPWGGSGVTITLSGNSRCSDTYGTYPNIGNPSSGGGGHCWCQMVSAGLSGAWAFLHDYGSPSCALICADYCSYNVRANSDFRTAVCVPASS